MIDIYIWQSEQNKHSIWMPYEINNEFLWNARRAAEEWKIKWVNYTPSFNDFWTPMEFLWKELDKLYNDFDILENNLDEIIKVVPLPKMIWAFDWSLYVWFKNPMEFDNYVELWTWDYVWQYFDKKSMLYLIWLIKKKILEAKEKWETLVFSGD